MESINNVDNITQLNELLNSTLDALDGIIKTENIKDGIHSLMIKISNVLNTSDIQIFKYDRVKKRFDTYQVLDIDKKPLYIEARYFLRNKKRKNFINPKELSFIEVPVKNDIYIISINNPIFNNEMSHIYLNTLKRIFNILFTAVSKQEEQKIKYLRDPLTGIGNRIAYDEAVSKTFNGKSKEETFALMDLFRLKAINDNFGHPAGDKYVKKSAEIVNNELTKRERNGFFRIGGDEFVLFMPGLKKAYIQEKLHQANLKLNKETLGFNLEFPLSLNYGVVEGREKINTFYKKADDELSFYKKELYKKLNIERRK